MRSHDLHSGRHSLTKLRWLSISAGVLALAALLLWLAAAPVIGWELERQLRRAGYAEPSVAGVSLAFPGVVIDRLQLAPADAFFLDGVRVRIGTNGMRSIAIDRLRLEAEVTADGELKLPGYDSAGNGELPLDLLPDQGVRLAQAEIHLTTPAGRTDLSMSDLSMRKRADGAELFAEYTIDHAGAHVEGAATAEVRSDGAVGARLQVAGGRIEARGVHASIARGEVAADLPVQDVAALTLNLETDETSIAGIALGGLVVEADWRDGIAEFALTSLDSRVADLSIEGRLDTREDAISVDLSGNVLLKETEGQLAFEADIARAAGDGARMSGQVQVTGRALAVPDVLRQGSIDFAAGFEGDTERVALTAVDGWTAAFTPDASLLPQALQALADKEVTVSMTPGAGAPLALRLAFAQESAQLDAAVDVVAGESRVDASASFTANWTSGVSVTAEALQMVGRDLPWGAWVLGVEGFEGRAAYAADAWRVEGASTLLAEGPLAGASVDGLMARWSGTATGTAESIVVVANECVAWDVASIERGEWRLEELSPPCIRPDNEDVLLRYETDRGRIRFDLSTAEAPLEAQLFSAGEQTPVRGTWPALVFSGAMNSEGLADLDAEASGGALTLSSGNVAFNGVAGAAEIRGSEISSSSLAVAAIESRATPAAWSPVSLEASAKDEGNKLSFEALLSDALGILVLEAAGEYEDGRATSAMTLYPIQFISGATEVADLSPLMADYVSDASGTVEFEGAIAWGPDGLESTGILDVRDFGATVIGTAIAGVDASTSLGSLLPLATLPGQRLEIGQLDLGIPLENGSVVYDLGADGTLSVQQMEFDLAGGRVYSEPFTVDSGEMRDIRFVLRAEEVELSQVLVLSQIEGLEGTGVLSGRVPVRMTDQGLQLDEGLLAAETDGILRYTPEDLPAFLRGDDVRSRMLREALTNFQYDELSVSVASEAGESAEQRLTLSAKGANPDFLEGHPIELNFNFRGPLLGAMRSAVDVTGAGEIEDMFEEQERENVETTQ